MLDFRIIKIGKRAHKPSPPTFAPKHILAHRQTNRALAQTVHDSIIFNLIFLFFFLLPTPTKNTNIRKSLFAHPRSSKMKKTRKINPVANHHPCKNYHPLAVQTNSHVSPHRTPKSPLGGGHQQPKYPQQQQHQPAGRVGSSTVSFSGGRPVLPQQAHPQQQQHYQPAPRPVSAPYHQQVQQQNRYSSPSTASLGSPRSPQIVGAGGHSPRGWAHVQSPVPVYRPAPQHHQQQQQYVPAPFQTDLNPSAYHRQASAGYGPRKVHY